MRLPKGAKEIRGDNFSGTDYPHKDITEAVIGCAIRVHRELKAGFIEGIYQAALCKELTKSGIGFECEKDLPVFYGGEKVGEHRADLIVEKVLVVELKSLRELTDQHLSQVMSTMRAAQAKVGLLINFGQARLVDGVRRIVL